MTESEIKKQLRAIDKSSLHARVVMLAGPLLAFIITHISYIVSSAGNAKSEYLMLGTALCVLTIIVSMVATELSLSNAYRRFELKLLLAEQDDTKE